MTDESQVEHLAILEMNEPLILEFCDQVANRRMSAAGAADEIARCVVVFLDKIGAPCNLRNTGIAADLVTMKLFPDLASSASTLRADSQGRLSANLRPWPLRFDAAHRGVCTIVRRVVESESTTADQRRGARQVGRAVNQMGFLAPPVFETPFMDDLVFDRAPYTPLPPSQPLCEKLQQESVFVTVCEEILVGSLFPHEAAGILARWAEDQFTLLKQPADLHSVALVSSLATGTLFPDQPVGRYWSEIVSDERHPGLHDAEVGYAPHRTAALIVGRLARWSGASEHQAAVREIQAVFEAQGHIPSRLVEV